ncbi:hypothetical protein ACHHYP_05114 [Achlya hypogyna]|uniref:EF-hand domain-containing protein n=1 Tax=Achlya hypogyna TaxID=1202772 RepID=A0A1V9YZ08_ACHHY|nr:hypothetical protein ACHHYP_05114 [Achlya hypogyna]
MHPRDVMPTKAVVDFVQKVSATRQPPRPPRESTFYETMVPRQPPSPRPVMDTSVLAQLAKVQLPSASKVNMYTSQLHPPTSPRVYCPRSPQTRPRTTPPSPRSDAAKPEAKLPPVDTAAREHLEIKACMLAHMYHVDVAAVEGRLEAQRHARDQRRASATADLCQERFRRKTQFLLDHYFCLGEHSSKESVLYDVVEDWTLGPAATPGSIASFWDDVNAHMEASYVLKATALTDNQPNKMAILVALDCLGKLAASLPAHRRLLLVLKLVLERGLFVTPATNADADGHRQLYYERSLKHEETIGDHVRSLAVHEAYHAAPPVHKIARIIDAVQDVDEQHRLLLQVVSSHLPQSKLGLAHLREAVVRCPAKDQRELVRAIAATRSSLEATGFAHDLHAAHPRALVDFVEEHEGLLDALLLQDGGGCVQRLMERHAILFAGLFVRAPSVLANIVQVAPDNALLEQVVDVHRSAIAHYLGRKPELFIPVVAMALKDNILALEEFLVKTPKALRDVLLNRPTLLPGIVKATPSILADLLVNAKATFGKVVTEAPMHLTYVCTTHAAAIATVFSTTECLGPILSLCPQALSEYLERNPDAIVDMAHRQPALLASLFAAFPDLLVEPLEANPTLISTLLTTNRQLMQSIRFEDLDAAPVAFRKTATDATQTDAAAPAQQVASATSKLKKRHNILSNIVKKRKVAPMEKNEVMREIAKLYVRKILFDEIDDRSGLDRVSLAESTQDIYIQELGLKSASQKRIASLVAGVKKLEKECSRARWFGVLLGASPEMYNAQAIDVYLHALQLLIAAPDIENRMGDSSQPCWVSLHLAKNLPSEVFKSYAPPEFLADLQQRIAALPSTCERKASTKSTKHLDPRHVQVNLDDVMDCVMTVWYEYQIRPVLWLTLRISVDDNLTVLFAQADEDGNGVLTYQEFETMIKKIDQSCDDRTIMRIFNMCGEENEQGEHEIKPADFATVMRTYPVQAPNEVAA